MKLTDTDLQRMRRLYQSRRRYYSMTEIGERFGVSRTTVRHHADAGGWARHFPEPHLESCTALCDGQCEYRDRAVKVVCTTAHIDIIKSRVAQRPLFAPEDQPR